MISVIVCSRKGVSWKSHERHIFETIGAEHEYLQIDNSRGALGICAAYNDGVDRSRGDILVFVHEDVFAVLPEWGKILEKKFNDVPALGMVGVAGTKYLFADDPFWLRAGRPFLHGAVFHDNLSKDRVILTAFSDRQGDEPVVAVDGLFFSIRRSLFSRIRFDEDTFGGFHFYDLDICMQILKTHSVIVTTDIVVKHITTGDSFDEQWKRYGRAFLNKYRGILPLSIDSLIPDRKDGSLFESYPLDQIVNREVALRIRGLGREKPAGA